tara:strand:- start:3678 stop:4796 length:1119 start_codon:yes stop_codon:yes gene_type:complete
MLVLSVAPTMILAGDGTCNENCALLDCEGECDCDTGECVESDGGEATGVSDTTETDDGQQIIDEGGVVFDTDDSDDEDDSDSDDDEEVEDVDEETEDEVEVMETSKGAEMRLLQLERRITRAVLHMESVIEFLEGKEEVSESVIPELQGIVVLCNELLEEVKLISPERGNEGSVKAFVEIKKEAIDLVHDFRKLAGSELTREDRKSLKLKFDSIDRAKLKDLKEEIENKRDMVHADKLRRLLEHLGTTDEDLLALPDDVESGAINIKKALRAIRAAYGELSNEEKEALRERLQNDKKKSRIEHVRSLLKAKEARLDRLSERAEKRSDRLRDHGFDRAADKLKERAERLDDASDKINEFRVKFDKNVRIRRAS